MILNIATFVKQFAQQDAPMQFLLVKQSAKEFLQDISLFLRESDIITIVNFHVGEICSYRYWNIFKYHSSLSIIPL